MTSGDSPIPASSSEPSPQEKIESEASARAGSSLARGSGPLAARGQGGSKPASPAMTSPPSGKQKSPQGRKKEKRDGSTPQESTPRQPQTAGSQPQSPQRIPSSQPMGSMEGPFRPFGTPHGATVADLTSAAPAIPPAAESPAEPTATPSAAVPVPRGRISVPNIRQPLADELQAALEAELAAADVGALLSSGAGLVKRTQLEEGERIRGRVIKFDDENVFFALGGPDEGMVSRLQFETPPDVGQVLDVVVRGFNRDDDLYLLVVPGQTLDVSDWEDLEEGTVVEAHVTAANTGGLEATVGSIRGFIPISQIAPYRVEDLSEFVGQRFACVVTECNPRRKNLVLSRRAVLEREREEQRQQQLAQIEPGSVLEGTVRSIKDFGAFVDLGGLDGMIHISKLSWENVKSPADVLEVGQKVKVKVDKIDKQTGKISLSYRDLLENPWDRAEAGFPVGSVVQGTVSRLANFGAFVRLAAGIEGLVHISEVAGHRVSNVSSLLKEGDEVQVKILSFERESQKIALSIKQAQTKASAATEKSDQEEDEPPRQPLVRRQGTGPLKGGVAGESGGSAFGLKW